MIDENFPEEDSITNGRDQTKQIPFVKKKKVKIVKCDPETYNEQQSRIR